MKSNNAENRKDRIFEIIVRSYIETGEPVGSRTISRTSQIRLSPASIRNVMADLEEEGFLQQPHTSAGRVPTDKGYRYYVDTLMEPESLSNNEKKFILNELKGAKTIEGLAERVSKVVSGMTDNTALIFIKNLKRISFLTYLVEELVNDQRIADFLEEEPELFVEGVFRIFEQPEFQDIHKMKLLLQAFDEKNNFFQIMDKDLEEEGIHVHIGHENEAGEFQDVSFVVKDCYLGDVPIGGVAVVGSKRMRYAKVVAVVDYAADTMTDTMRRF
jgi:transcriptional regulator of heat shock response